MSSLLSIPAKVRRRAGVAACIALSSASFAQDQPETSSPPAEEAASAVEAATPPPAETKAVESSSDLPATPAPSDAAPTASSDAAEATESVEAPDLAPTVPDPLVTPLEEPPVATDLVAGGAEPTPTESVVVNLINRLVDRGVLTQGDAAELVSQARRDAAVASQNAAAAALVAADAAMASEEDIVVTHIPGPVKDRLREEIREEILEELPIRDTHFVLAESGKEAVVLPERAGWQENIRLFGDLRLRYDASRFPDGNDNTGSFPDFNRINTGAPFDVAGFQFSPQLNVDEDRRRFRMRARAGVHADLGDGFMIGFRAATGNDNSPVSTNQTLSGNFNKYSLWLDQAFIRWDGAVGSTATSVSAGRFDNPFFKTSDIMWDNDLAFDGIVAKASPELNERVGAFLTVGAFPLFSSGFNFPTNDPDKFESMDRYFFGGQTGIDVVLSKQVEGRFAIGYHDFDDVEGKLSEPFVPITSSDAGSTDERRPTFAQKGNTYMALRNITPDPLNNYGTTDHYQYYGLASEFDILSYNSRIDLNFWEPFQIALLAEYAMNVGFDKNAIDRIAVNNRGPIPAGGAPGAYEGGNVAWNAGVQFGKPVLANAWDWNALVGYRFVESDAVLDAFADSDFGLGGTNVEGFTIGAGVAVNSKINLNLRWMGATEIAGPPLKSDVFQFDFNAKF